MKTIWFVYPYGPLPSEKAYEGRYARFARILAQQGYKCVWWTANFDHSTKVRRCEGWKTIDVCDNFQIKLVPTSAYKKNISLGRVKFELDFAKNLKRRFKRTESPDLIITSGTGLFTAFRPVWPYMKKNGIPVIFDIMDVHMINAYMRTNHKVLAPFVKLITSSINLLERPFYHNVSGVSGLGRNQLEIAKERTGNRDIPSCLVYNGIHLDVFRQQAKNEITIDLPQKRDGEVWCVYAGSLGPSYDIDTVVKCAEMAERNNDNVIFIIAGSGPKAETLVDYQRNNSHLHYLGVLKPEELAPIYAKCDIGLCTYASYSTVDMPDKFYDYCASGLAIINSLQGEVKGYILDNGIGIQYEAGDDESLYSCIRKISRSETLYQSKKNADNIAPNFDLANLMIPLVKMINELTAHLD